MRRARAGFEKKAAPELARVLEPGESVAASGYGQVQSGWFRTATSGLQMAHYWVVVTDHRLLLLRLIRVGTAMETERAEPLANVHVVRKRNMLAFRRLALEIEGDEYPLLFGPGWLKDADAIAEHLRH